MQEIKERYVIDFYDMIDGWILGWQAFKEWRFNSLEKAKAFALKKQGELDLDNQKCGEHYGVIDLTTGKEVFCTQKYEWASEAF